MRFRWLLLILLALPAVAGAREVGGLSELAAIKDARCTIASANVGSISVTVDNLSAEPLTIVQPAGLICAAGDGSRSITLRATRLEVAPRQSADAVIPAAALSSAHPAGPQALHVTSDTEPRLAGLLEYLGKQNDVPRMTAQFLVLCLVEDINFAKWQRFVATQRGVAAADPTPDEVVTAVDVLGVLREIAPKQTFALASDPDLKLRALRTPVARGKAMQLYGMTLPDEPSVAPLPPTLGSLLHTRPGDNCPICRQRALMQPREDGL